jgi:phosphate transport system substrate-binding protein
VTVGTSGTGGGFEKFCAGETDISDASRAIEEDEIAACRSAGIAYEEFQIANDGLSVVVNTENDWAQCLTVDQLRTIWNTGSKVDNWNQVDPSFPDQELSLYGAGTDSGTFDYFTEAIMHEAGACRSDYTASEDDNLLVQGVSGDADALGFFGYAYYFENRGILKLVPIDGGAGPIEPAPDTIENGTYTPLSRPLFIYVSRESADRPEVEAFIEFYMANADDIVGDVGYIALPPEAYALALERFRRRVAGSVFAGAGAQVGVTVADLLSREGR